MKKTEAHYATAGSAYQVFNVDISYWHYVESLIGFKHSLLGCLAEFFLRHPDSTNGTIKSLLDLGCCKVSDLQVLNLGLCHFLPSPGRKNIFFV